eukprot:7428092-Pyramimonas_sp.AAC.1
MPLGHASLRVDGGRRRARGRAAGREAVAQTVCEGLFRDVNSDADLPDWVSRSGQLRSSRSTCR